MQTVIIVIHLMLVLAMVGTVLLQKSEGGGLGMGSGGGFMSSRGTANLLTRTTAILAALFFATSLLLSILAGMGRKPTSILGGPSSAPTQQQAPGNAPLAPGGKGVLGTLGGQQPAAPAAPGNTPAPAAPSAPAAPAGPQVPQSQ